MKKLLTLISILYAVNTSAQFRHPVFSDTEPGYSVGVYGRYQLASNALSSNLLWAAYQGKHIDRKILNQASDRSFKLNRVGVDLDYGIYARHLPDSSKGIGWYINIADRTHANATYSKDLFDLAMFGNAMFAGKTADLSNIKANFISYKQWEVGILKNIGTSKGKWQIGFGLGLLTGNRNLNVDISEAELFTDADGDYLEGSIHGEARSSSLNATQFIDANGLGMSAAMTFAYQGEKFGVRFDAHDLGFIRWSTGLRHTEFDSVFHFEGVDINLFGTGGAGFSSVSLDTVVDGFVSKLDATPYTIATPARMRLEGFYRLKSEGLHIYAGVQYRIASGYVPLGYVGVSSPLPKQFYIDGRFAYGGFGSWSIGLELRKKFGQVLEVRLGSNNLEGFVLPMVGTSQSAYLSIAGYF